MRITSFSTTLFLAFWLLGCNNSDAQRTPSLKPKSQLDFENELRNLNLRVERALPPGTRAYEAANKDLENFWKTKASSITRVDGWVCRYSDAYKWVPTERDGYYELIGFFCNDADRPYNAIELYTSEIDIRIHVSKARNIEPIYSGDVIAVSGPIRNSYSGIRPHGNSYRINIDADSMRIIKKGGN